MLVSTYLYATKSHNQQVLLRRLGRFLRFVAVLGIAFNIYMLSFLFMKVVPGSSENFRSTLRLEAVYYFFLSLACDHRHSLRHAAEHWLCGLFGRRQSAFSVAPQATRFQLLGLHTKPANFLPLAYGGIILAGLS